MSSHFAKIPIFSNSMSLSMVIVFTNSCYSKTSFLNAAFTFIRFLLGMKIAKPTLVSLSVKELCCYIQ